jgi:hypothetical protein
MLNAFRRLARIGALASLAAFLAGCVVVPRYGWRYEGRYYYDGHYHDRYHYREDWRRR